ncbi:putative integral membrane protein [Aspergillus ruber CBS 135680]|uniref:Putative integral membrane protein n=1 Tax=Aspergillus ruber (strain CBS 135680) TaxID=1388766 RepID=A0A017SBT2_ASPRC|nr:putative integral membrane protein [Aspergillus ruber CBS 135680]EYE94059.1 putative integral membrane protein [Aspergillus ruber CBS 135680]
MGATNSTRLGGTARRSLGISLLLVVVVLWTASNFLASTIFADNTYSKPFFLTYLNTSCFILPLLGILLARIFKLWRLNKFSQITSLKSLLEHLDSGDPLQADEQNQPILYHRAATGDGEEGDDDIRATDLGTQREIVMEQYKSGKLGLRETAKLSLQFCILWANYFAMACLQHTTVGSTTILTSTSGVWTMVFGAALCVEKFTLRKFLGVIASLLGIILISRVDLSTSDAPAPDDSGNNGSFPHKSSAEIALGDAMAAFSAIMYGVYTIVMKRQCGDESRVNMPLFFGLVGFFNMVFIWPGFIIMHFTGLEKFELPPTDRVWTILLVNSVSSLVSDIVWAYAMLLTTPLVVTVGLSLTIPLSLVGQIILQNQYASPLYWVGAVIVFLSFLVVNHESRPVEEEVSTSALSSGGETGEYRTVPGEER